MDCDKQEQRRNSGVKVKRVFVSRREHGDSLIVLGLIIVALMALMHKMQMETMTELLAREMHRGEACNRLLAYTIGTENED